jgi:pimeloyl-ACP methyl ester carboxylesterase
MSRRRALASVLVLAAALGLLLPFLFPEIGLEAWRTATRLRHGAESGTVVVDGVELAWSAVGEGPSVLLLHGLRGEIPVLLPLADALADRGFRSVLIDLPGHGRSATWDRPLDIASAGRFTLGAAEKLGLEDSPPMVGHSLGGWVLLWQALERPERVGPLVAVSSPGLRFEPPPKRVLMPSTVPAARDALPLLFADPPRVPGPLLWIGIQRRRETAEELLGSILSGRFLLDDRLARLEEPVLFVSGTEDRLVPPSVSVRMASRSGSPYVGIPEAGHMVVWERTERLAEVIASFLRTQAVSSAPRKGSAATWLRPRGSPFAASSATQVGSSASARPSGAPASSERPKRRSASP